MRKLPWPSTAARDAGADEIRFVADVHLAPSEPAWIDRFCAFVETLPGGQLVLLGDLFHLYWGPEMLDDPLWGRLIAALRDRGRGGRVLFLPGNRDFHGGVELNRRASVDIEGEVLTIRSGDKCIYACHGDQLCQKDRGYQHMKRVIRSPPVLRLWRRLPRFVRKRFAGGLRWATRQHLAMKAPPQLTVSGWALRTIFKRGANVIVSGHRHVLGSKAYVVNGRECVHYELPPWSETGIFLLSRAGTISLGRYEE
jgi:UDP-2,3-diacylglucosamine hydrolase